MRKWDKLRELSRDEQLRLLQAWALLPVVRMMLRMTGYRRTISTLQRLSPRKPRNPHQASADMNDNEKRQLAMTLGRLTNAAANHGPLEINCLPRSIVLWWMLRRAGLPAELRIGVQKEPGAFAAHAWVEYAGAPVGDAASAHFSPILSSFPPMEGRTH